MTDLGLLNYFLGIEVHQGKHFTTLSQYNYASELLKKMNMQNCKPSNVPMSPNLRISKDVDSPNFDGTKYRSAVGSLLYLTATRPDIQYAVGVVARFMSNPKEKHWNVVKKILRYVAGTLHFGLLYGKQESPTFHAYCDADWGGCLDTLKSTIGSAFMIGEFLIAWISKKQSLVAQSIAESEYVAMAATVQQIMWLVKLFDDLKFEIFPPTPIYSDSKSAVSIALNPVMHQRTKHFDLKYHFIRDVVSNGQIQILFVQGTDQFADIFTKSLPATRFKFTMHCLKILNISIKGENT
eukprot:TRINITY_DN14889_c0_g1_i4.p1 TRINITY_DN14889_c0_g1~~TRINITY_DN14889_c0_g1_i4.p1  ORF type:complete len:342 (-),score=63.55 TRINITY_DN14889_c0_g1_i4:372-1256(-)